MNEITLIKCKDCGVMYPADKKHECDIKVLHGYRIGRSDTIAEICELLGAMLEESKDDTQGID